jgi:hypothetical protein
MPANTKAAGFDCNKTSTCLFNCVWSVLKFMQVVPSLCFHPSILMYRIVRETIKGIARLLQKDYAGYMFQGKAHFAPSQPHT